MMKQLARSLTVQFIIQSLSVNRVFSCFKIPHTTSTFCCNIAPDRCTFSTGLEYSHVVYAMIF